MVDEAVEVMRDGVMKSMIHPQFYNNFVDLLFKHGHIDTAINFLKEVGKLNVLIIMHHVNLNNFQDIPLFSRM